MPSAQKDQTHKTKPQKNQKIKRTISNMRRKAPPLPAVRHKGSGQKWENPKTGKSRKDSAYPEIKGPQALITQSAKRAKKPNTHPRSEIRSGSIIRGNDTKPSRPKKEKGIPKGGGK